MNRKSVRLAVAGFVAMLSVIGVSAASGSDSSITAERVWCC
jgi:hypothetical protein